MARYHNIIIGSGQAGNPLASFLAQKGESCLLIEKAHLGGSCVNVGCTPSKTFYESVRKMHHAKIAGYAGFDVVEQKFDFAQLMAFVRDVRNKSNESLTKSLEETENLRVLRGHARFTAPKQLKVTQEDGRQLEFEGQRIFINTGSQPSIPPLEGIDDVDYLTNQNVWELKKQPESLIILGGGYIGLELAQSFARAGTQVRVIESNERILSHEDEDLTRILTEKLQEEGVVFELGSKARAVSKHNDNTRIELENEKCFTAEKLLIAVGRTPNTHDLGLEHTSIDTDEQGHIKTDEHLRSTQEDVFAMGEVADSAYFTHISYDDYRIVKATLENDQTHGRSERVVPNCMFTDPQLAGFGMNEKEAREKEVDYHLYKMPMSSVSRAREMNETTGLIKVLCDGKGGRIIGVRILGAEAGEMMSVLQVAQAGALTADQLHEFIFAHPLLAEGFNNLFA